VGLGDVPGTGFAASAISLLLSPWVREVEQSQNPGVLTSSWFPQSQSHGQKAMGTIQSQGRGFGMDLFQAWPLVAGPL
jgi:hypothetical protein